MNLVNVLHVFFIGPFLIYIGLMKPNNVWVFKALFLLGALVFLKFGFLLLTTQVTQQSVWYILHMMFFSLLALYVGFMKSQTPQIGYSLILATGIAAFGYHLIRGLGFR